MRLKLGFDLVDNHLILKCSEPPGKCEKAGSTPLEQYIIELELTGLSGVLSQVTLAAGQPRRGAKKANSEPPGKSLALAKSEPPGKETAGRKARPASKKAR